MSGTTVVAAMNYSYDAASQLVSASGPNSAYAFTYDGDGNVLTVDNNGTPGVPDVLLTSAYDSIGDRTSLAATVAGVKNLMNSYSYDADQRLTMLQQQGQSGGNTVSPKEVDLAYNALGQFTSIADFTGGHIDVETGFVDDYHRWYDPSTGRWLCEDQKGFEAQDANLERYARDNPTSSAEATGLQMGGYGPPPYHLDPLPPPPHYDPSYFGPRLPKNPYALGGFGSGEYLGVGATIQLGPQPKKTIFWKRLGW